MSTRLALFTPLSIALVLTTSMLAVSARYQAMNEVVSSMQSAKKLAEMQLIPITTQQAPASPSPSHKNR